MEGEGVGNVHNEFPLQEKSLAHMNELETLGGGITAKYRLTIEQWDMRVCRRLEVV